MPWSIRRRRVRRWRALPFHGVTDQFDGALAEPREVFFGEPQQLRDHPGGKLEGELLDQIGMADVDELVDQSVDDRPYDFGFPS